MRARKTSELESTLIIGERPAPDLEPAASTDLAIVPANEAFTPGTEVDHYVIEGEVGAGGMGVVYKAHDTLLDRTVALKILPPGLCTNADFVRRFANEAKLQARIDSPHVVTLHALTEKPLGLVLVMEHLEGETLEQRLRRRGPLSVEQAIDVFAQASVAVEHIHRMGIIHQDLKPANIFITLDGRLKLLDFGVAKLMDDQAMAQRGTLMGTLLYMSPEQIKGREVDYRCDIYTLGITMFEAVTGRLPFERKTNYALMHAHVQENPPPPRKYQTEIPRELEKLILKAIAKEPDRRFQTMGDFRKALLRHRKSRNRQFQPVLASIPASASARVRGGRIISPHDDGPGARKRLVLGSAVFDALLLAGIAVLLLFLGLSARDQTDSTNTAANHSVERTEFALDPYASLKKLWGNRQTSN